MRWKPTEQANEDYVKDGNVTLVQGKKYHDYSIRSSECKINFDCKF